MSLTPEGLIKNQICEWLSYQRDMMFWQNQSVGVYDPGKGIFRKCKSKYQRNGVADILGVYKGKPLAIEVKSKKGYPTVEQKAFLAEFEKMGGIAILARSIEDVEKVLKQVDQRCA